MALFDTQYYLGRNPDVAAAGFDPALHYDLFGFREGRDPSLFFDTSFYLGRYADVAAAGVNPLDHFVDFGAREGRDPTPAFDTSFYLQQNPDVAASPFNPLDHFIRFGNEEGRAPVVGFEAAAYLDANPDVAAAVAAGLTSAAEHYVAFGFAEGRALRDDDDGDGDSDGDGDGDGDADADFTLQLFHLSDQEAGAAAVIDAPNLSAVLNALRAEDLDDDGTAGFDDTLTLSSGDAYIPGLFFDASETAYGQGGVADILIQNALGIEAIAFGNHEFDLGTGVVRNLITGTATVTGDDGTTSVVDIEGFDGTDFPYLSGNLDFSTEENLDDLVVDDAEAPEGGAIAASTVLTTGSGERIGVVGATTPTLASISSPDGITIMPMDFGGVPTAAQLDALAAEIQLDVDALLAGNGDVDKVVLLAHMQSIAIEYQLAERLTDVDIIVAGGSNTRLLDETDRLRPGDSSQGDYPQFFEDADGNPIAVVNTDGNYKYIGRLVLDFDENGLIIPESYDAGVSGAYASDETGVEAVGGEGLADPEIVAVTDMIRDVIIQNDGNFFGVTDVFLNAERFGGGLDGIRTQETNLGNLTADANLALAQEIDDSVVVSVKNGGGIRASIGDITVPAGAVEPVREAPDANPLSGRPEGGISQNAIQSTLAFNNALSIVSLDTEELVSILEFGVAASSPDQGNAQGRFPQVAGVEFSFDPEAAAGDRIQSARIVGDDGETVAELVRDGAIVDNGAETFRVVTLTFLVEGGDGYVFPTGPGLERVDLGQPEDAARTGLATFAADGTEQDALAEYLAQTFPVESPYDQADTPVEEDERIQNLAFRDDDVFDGADGGIMAMRSFAPADDMFL